MELDDKALIDAYLHGELSDPDQEILEERFFVEDDLFEKIETCEMQLVDRFVRGEMDSDEAVRFEAGYITSPERQKKVAKVRLFHKELGELKGERKGWLSGFSSLFEIRIPVLQFAGGAALILICVGAIWTVLVFRSSPEDVAVVDVNGIELPVNTVPQKTPPVSPEPVNNNVRDKQETKAPTPEQGGSPAPQLPIPNIRIQPAPGPIVTNKLEGIVVATLEPGTGGGAPKTVAVRISQKTVFLSLNLPLPTAIKGESFSVVVTDDSGRQVSMTHGLKPRGTKGGRVLAVTLPTEKFDKGPHNVTATAKDVASESVRYRFNVERIY